MKSESKKGWIYHVELSVLLLLIAAVLCAESVREIPVNVEVDATPLQEADVQLTSEIDRLISLQEVYELNLEELRSLAACGGLDRLSSGEATVGRVFYIGGEPFFYKVSLKEYLKAEDDIKFNSVSRVDKSYIRPLTPDIEFLARQFIQRYPDKTDRALAILALIQNLGYDENDVYFVKHPTVTLMRGGVCIDLVIACGALLEAADINCAILIFGCQGHSAIGISDIDFKKFKREIGETAIITYEGREYLICETTSLRHPAGSDLMISLRPINSETVTMIIPYEFP